MPTDAGSKRSLPPAQFRTNAARPAATPRGANTRSSRGAVDRRRERWSHRAQWCRVVSRQSTPAHALVSRRAAVGVARWATAGNRAEGRERFEPDSVGIFGFQAG
jgi:hypothetical protein